MIGTTGAASALTPENLVGVIARTANVDPQHAAHALRAADGRAQTYAAGTALRLNQNEAVLRSGPPKEFDDDYAFEELLPCRN
jgi:hypothetical protein